MSAALEHAFATATEDVRCALRWLLGNGFALDQAQGGPQESFGNVWLLLVRDDCRVEVARDRSQWALDVTPAWATKRFGFHVLLTAKAGREPDEPAWKRFPQQLPPGVSWCDELPQVLDWLADGVSRAAVTAADVEWQEAMKRRLSSRRDAP